MVLRMSLLVINNGCLAGPLLSSVSDISDDKNTSININHAQKNGVKTLLTVNIILINRGEYIESSFWFSNPSVWPLRRSAVVTAAHLRQELPRDAVAKIHSTPSPSSRQVTMCHQSNNNLKYIKLLIHDKTTYSCPKKKYIVELIGQIYCDLNDQVPVTIIYYVFTL